MIWKTNVQVITFKVHPETLEAPREVLEGLSRRVVTIRMELKTDGVPFREYRLRSRQDGATVPVFLAILSEHEPVGAAMTSLGFEQKVVETEDEAGLVAVRPQSTHTVLVGRVVPRVVGGHQEAVGHLLLHIAAHVDHLRSCRETNIINKLVINVILI